MKHNVRSLGSHKRRVTYNLQSSFFARSGFLIRRSLLALVFVFLLIYAGIVEAGDVDNLSKYIHPTVDLPVRDGISLDIPQELARQNIAKWGFVDVTQSPFGADPTGSRDSTEAIQKAIDFARDHQMVCFFPGGTYIVSDTLSCIQNLYRRSNNKVVGARNFPCLLMGSRKGKRPRIVLSANSPGFQNPKKLKYVIHFWARYRRDLTRPAPAVSFNQMFVNIDIEVGKGNPGAVAIRHRAAQGSGVQECTIDVTHGHTGLEGGAGSGGSHTGVTIIGGKVGLDLSQTQPTPTIVGITLIGQKETAILYRGRQSLCAVGLRIVSKNIGPIIRALPVSWNPHHGQMCLVDSEIVFERPGGIVISSACSLYLNNVYVKGASKVVSNLDGSVLLGNPEGWIQIEEYAHGARPSLWKGLQYEAPVYMDGVRTQSDRISYNIGKGPPPDLQSRHLWDEDFPTWETGQAMNVKMAPYNAKGDGKTDDTSAIQRAVAENEVVFLPKGYYNITKTIQLKPTTKLLGVGRHLSILMVRRQSKTFLQPYKPSPLLQTANIKDAETVVAFCGVYTPKTVPEAYALRWRCGGRSLLRAVNFMTFPPLQGFGSKHKKTKNKPRDRNAPLVVISDNGGGKWYNFFQEDGWRHGPKYRHLLVRDVEGPLHIYQCNPEHSIGEANMEISDSRYVTIYGMKGETNPSVKSYVLKIQNSDQIQIFGYGGNAQAMEGEALFWVSDTPNFLFANIVDTPILRFFDPKKWHILEEHSPKGDVIKTKPLDRPVLYLRGDPLRN